MAYRRSEVNKGWEAGMQGRWDARTLGREDAGMQDRSAGLRTRIVTQFRRVGQGPPYDTARIAFWSEELLPCIIAWEHKQPS